MPDVKDIIEGLEMSYKFSNVDEENTLVPQELVLHAIELLKVLEPKVMTWDEVLERRPFHLWVEDLDTGAIVFPVAYINETYRDAAMDWGVAMDFAYDDYGKRWRFWDRKPTQKQREAVKWE